MSWLARSIANSLRLDEVEDVPGAEDRAPHDTVPEEDPPGADRRSSGDCHSSCGGDDEIDGGDNRRGVKEDLSELKDSLARQFWGVASFLAPPPPPPPPPPSILRSGVGDREGEELVEQGGGEPCKFGPLEDFYTDVVDCAIGVSEEVLAFARDIAHHPETWLDFPFSEEDEFDDFDISDAQYKHALAVEHLAPRLAALRIELCPVHMSESYFWMVYFVLLHSRLSKHDADLLTSSQLVQARIMWMYELEKRTKELSGLVVSTEPSDSVHQNFIMHSDEYMHARPEYISEPENEIEKNSVNETKFVDKSVIKEDLTPKLQEKEMILSSVIAKGGDHVDDKDDDDDWLKDMSDFIGYSDKSVKGNEEDISFSDLEDDLDHTIPVRYEIVTSEENS
ncbi:BSD domain-containing family protein [Striga asiatica]|uniref:BSD domain-containing family protein n=1 Tax=Striga asiatica TaxID=4170 RepID=A0A5A7PLG4_STRAF|nr:BSD domain-containing family protein [Striga asiatica]